MKPYRSMYVMAVKDRLPNPSTGTKRLLLGANVVDLMYGFRNSWKGTEGHSGRKDLQLCRNQVFGADLV